MRLLAPAKINLHLRVGPPMADGFHPLLTWMVTVGLFDTLGLSIMPHGSPQVVLECDDPSLPVDGRNLVVKAAKLFFEAFAIAGSVHVKLGKSIPAGGGLGGGSSDAAAMLVGMRRLFSPDGITDDSLHQLAAKLGSDVTFFLHGASAICTGRGEVVRAIGRPTPRWALLLTPPFGVSTPEAYRRFDQMNLGRPENVNIGPDWREWHGLSAEKLLTRLVNDLEAPAFAMVPELGVMREEYEQKLARPVRMSGSGSTLFTVYDRREEAEAGAVKIKQKDLGAIVVDLAP